MNLYIDTHLDDIVIILFANSKIIKKEIITAETKNSTLIMPTIKKVLDGKMPKSIVVCNGPGSFTGVRLGVTIAKTLAYTLNIPIRTITSLECLAVSLKYLEKLVAFSDKNGYYIGHFDSYNNPINDYQYLSLAEFDLYKKTHDVKTNIELQYDLILSYSMNKETLNPHAVKPIYIKKLAVEK